MNRKVFRGHPVILLNIRNMHQCKSGHIKNCFSLLQPKSDPVLFSSEFKISFNKILESKKEEFLVKEKLSSMLFRGKMNFTI